MQIIFNGWAKALTLPITKTLKFKDFLKHFAVMIYARIKIVEKLQSWVPVSFVQFLKPSSKSLFSYIKSSHKSIEQLTSQEKKPFWLLRSQVFDLFLRHLSSKHSKKKFFLSTCAYDKSGHKWKWPYPRIFSSISIPHTHPAGTTKMFSSLIPRALPKHALPYTKKYSSALIFAIFASWGS